MPEIKSQATDSPIVEKIKNTWFKLTGSPVNFALESRIFHSISAGLTILCAVYIPYNFFAGLYIASGSAFALCIFFSYQYYNSRFRLRKHNNTAFALTGIIIFSVNYFANAGIHGSTDIIWPVYLLFVLAVSPYRQHILWVSVYLFSFAILHLFAYHYPSLVHYPFNIGRGQLIDRITAFPLPIVTVYILINFIRKSYDKERTTANEKTLAIALKNEQISQQKEQLERSNAEKNKLMSIISHDMRAPLVNIQSYLELLSEMEVDRAERTVLEKALLTATTSTIQMLSNLLYWSKSQMEGQTISLMELNLHSVLNNTLEMEKMLAANKGICLTYNVAPNLTVVADTDMMQLVVRNLVNNAIKFTPSGGMINIEAQTVGNECRITITDTGNGISPDNYDKIFSITAQPSFGTNNEKGIGLGLLLCKEFIELQSGSIRFESTYGQGTSFFIFIPCPVRQLSNQPVPDQPLAVTHAGTPL